MTPSCIGTNVRTLSADTVEAGQWCVFDYNELRAPLTEESSMLCDLYLTILGRKESSTTIVSDFLK